MIRRRSPSSASTAASPGVGDIKANANIIKRTFQNFGIHLEMDEVSVGPTVTRYAVKPAEGVRLSKIVSLANNLELALAAHPVRIEAPIPGKSLVGIEVPNTVKAMVGLGGLLSSPEWTESKKPLLAALGRDIAGTPHYVNIAQDAARAHRRRDGLRKIGRHSRDHYFPPVSKRPESVALHYD